MIQNRLAALIFRACGFVCALAGLLTHFKIFSGGFSPGALMYYTIQSNLLALVLFAMLLVRTARGLSRDGRRGNAGYFARFEMVCVIDLLLTMLVYWVLLVPTAFTMGGSFELFTFDNVAVHLLTPLFCLVDYLLFTPSGHLRYSDVYAVLIFPLLYVVFASIAGFSGYTYRIAADGPVHFPYFFMDYDRVGAGAIIYILALAAFFLLLSHGLYWLDKKWKRGAIQSP